MIRETVDYERAIGLKDDATADEVEKKMAEIVSRLEETIYARMHSAIDVCCRQSHTQRD